MDIVCYADDSMFIVVSEGNLQTLLHESVTTLNDYNILVSTDITVTDGREPVRDKLEIKGKIIDTS